MKKIVVMHRASIGDMLLATPVYREIKKTYPKARLIVVTSHIGGELLQGMPCIDQLIPYDKGDSLLGLIKAIWRADVALILDFHYRHALYAFLALIPKRIGMGKDFINVKAEIETEFEGAYEPYYYLRQAEYLGVKGKSTGLEPLRPTREDLAHVKKIMSRHGLQHDRLVIMAPYSLKDIKNWEPAKYSELMQRLQKKGIAVAMIGGRENYERAAREFPGAVNLMGETNLRETFALISEADLLVCGCTSVLHICSGSGTHVLAIYGPTSPKQWAPKQNCTVITHNFPCSPCNGERACVDNQCIKSITVDEVWEQALPYIR